MTEVTVPMELAGVPDEQLIDGRPTSFFLAVPITEAEYETRREHGHSCLVDELEKAAAVRSRDMPKLSKTIEATATPIIKRINGTLSITDTLPIAKELPLREERSGCIG